MELAADVPNNIDTHSKLDPENKSNEEEAQKEGGDDNETEESKK